MLLKGIWRSLKCGPDIWKLKTSMEKQDKDKWKFKRWCWARCDWVLDDSVLWEFRGRKECGVLNRKRRDGIWLRQDKWVKSESAGGKASRWRQLCELILEMEMGYLGRCLGRQQTGETQTRIYIEMRWETLSRSLKCQEALFWWESKNPSRMFWVGEWDASLGQSSHTLKPPCVTNIKPSASNLIFSLLSANPYVFLKTNSALW